MSDVKRVAIVDYGMGNIFSLFNAILKVGHEAEIVTDPELLLDFDVAVLPGVGAFPDAMDRLNYTGLDEGLKKFCCEGKKLLGICLGMQLLFSKSEELGTNPGLDLVPGIVRKFPSFPGYKIPQIQWNEANVDHEKSKMFSGLGGNNYFYFLHSFYVKPDEQCEINITSNYCGIDYCSGFEAGNIFGTQFHPEKSGVQGLILLKNFIESGENR